MQSVGLQYISKLVTDYRLSEFAKTPASWFQSHEQEVFAFVQGYVTAYGVLPTLEILTEKYQVEGVPAEMPFTYVKEELSKRALLNAFHLIAPEINKFLDKQDPYAALSAVKNMVDGYERHAVATKDVYTLTELGELVQTYIKDNRFKEGMTGVPTGWDTLDVETSGWQKGDVSLMVARPKLGKSMLMGYSANAAYEAGFIPLLISMEMKALQYSRRLFAMRANIPMNSMKSGRVTSYSEQRLSEEVTMLQEKQPFYFVEGQFKRDLQSLTSTVYALKPDIVFIDAGYLIKVATKNTNKWERMTEIIEQLKYLAMTADIPIIVSFQFNRDAVKKDKAGKIIAGTPGLENIQLADAIGQIASVIIGIFDEEDTDIRRRRIEIIGGREGESGTFFVNWLWDSRMDFDEIKLEDNTFGSCMVEGNG